MAVARIWRSEKNVYIDIHLSINTQKEKSAIMGLGVILFP
jgi:hypothetical protein